MKIGIIGAGNVGTALAKRLVPQGHEVMLSYSRDAAKLARTAEAFDARHGTPVEAAASGDVVALTVPWGGVPEALAAAGDLSGKILWDCTNALLPDLSGLAIGTTTSGGEEVARLAAGAKVVKGIPPMAELLHSDDPTIGGKPVSLFVAGDDAGAKARVAELLAALPAEVTDAGGLSAARLIEPAMMLLVRLAYGLGHGSRVNLRFEKD
jgi:8-hydroxy-5-deazaflavin:NADPH oxidoreductase